MRRCKWRNGSNTKLYFAWRNMRRRCLDRNDSAYENYGGRGIAVCGEWIDDYDAFHDWATAAGYREGLTLDRIDVNGDYSPDNCRWTTWVVQLNNRRDNAVIHWNGESKTISEWCDDLGFDKTTAYKRHSRYTKDPEEIFHKGNLYSLRAQRRSDASECARCGCTETCKWRVGLCHNCYHSCLRESRREGLAVSEVTGRYQSA